MTTPALADVPVRSSLALTRRWVSLLSPLSFPGRTLWLAWLGPDGRQSAVLAPVEDLPVAADRHLAAGLLGVHAEVARSIPGEDVHLAMALARPGDPVPTEDDDEWAGAFHDVLDSALDGTWSLHLAAGGRVEPLVQSPNFFVRVGRAGEGPWRRGRPSVTTHPGVPPGSCSATRSSWSWGRSTASSVRGTQPSPWSAHWTTD